MKNLMRGLAAVLFIALAAFAAEPAYEQGFVSTIYGTNIQELGEHFLPTAETVDALAVKFDAKVQVRPLDGGVWKYWIPLEPLPAGWKWQFGFTWPFAKTKQAYEKSLIFNKGRTLPGGYVLSQEVAIPAWFFADAVGRKLSDTDLWLIVQRHDEQTKFQTVTASHPSGGSAFSVSEKEK